MDRAGRLVRSLRSLGPQADLKAAAIGAVVLLRERLGLRARVPARPVINRAPHRLILLIERYTPNRAGIALTVLMLLGSAGLGIVKGGHLDEMTAALRCPQCAGQFGRFPHHDGCHQRPQAIEPG